MSSSDTTHISASTGDYSEVSGSDVEGVGTQTNAASPEIGYPQAIDERIHHQGEQYAWLGILAKNAIFTAQTAAIL